MKIGSDCSGPCNTCKVSYVGGCLAGHGDDDYCYASPEWITAYKEEKERKDAENMVPMKIHRTNGSVVVPRTGNIEVDKRVREFYEKELDYEENSALREQWFKEVNNLVKVKRPTKSLRPYKITARVNNRVYSKLQKYCKDKDMSMSEAVDYLLGTVLSGIFKE